MITQKHTSYSDQVIIVLDNIRSAQNVGTILRTMDGFGISTMIAIGITPIYSAESTGQYLPHVRARVNNKISKASLGAEKTIKISHKDDLITAIEELKLDGYHISAIEQFPEAKTISKLDQKNGKIALVFGNEVEGITESVSLFNDSYYIPMWGTKNSHNISTSVAISLYQLLHTNH